MTIRSATTLLLASTLMLGSGNVPEAMAPEAFEPEAALAGAAAGVAIDLPFRATWTADGPLPDPISPPPPGTCSDGAISLLPHTYTGEATHLGRFKMDASVCNYGAHYGGFGTIIAANGDLLTMVVENGRIHLFAPPIIVYRDDFTITGGTGRFASASGGGTEEIHFDGTVGYGSGVMTGTIRYVASDRSARP